MSYNYSPRENATRKISHEDWLAYKVEVKIIEGGKEDALEVSFPIHDFFDFNPEEAHVTCAKFGCGRELSRQEQLFGRYCADHQKRETNLSIIDKYIY